MRLRGEEDQRRLGGKLEGDLAEGGEPWSLTGPVKKLQITPTLLNRSGPGQ